MPLMQNAIGVFPLITGKRAKVYSGTTAKTAIVRRSKHHEKQLQTETEKSIVLDLSKRLRALCVEQIRLARPRLDGYKK